MAAAGGIFYHLRALHARRAWQQFRGELGGWLDEWQAGSEVVLVGPSAGHCIDDAFLRRFRAVTALEPDPIARWWLARRLSRLGVDRVTFIAQDRLVSPSWTGGPALDGILRGAPGASVLFANLLGQLPFLLPDSRRPAWQVFWSDRIAPALAGRPWASFHDRISTAVRPRLRGRRDTAARLVDTELASLFFPHVRGTVEFRDHDTDGLFPAALPHSYFHWELEPGAHHLIEAVRG